MCVSGNKKLAARSTDGKEVKIKDDSLTGDAREQAVQEALKEQGVGTANCATGGGRIVFGKYQTGESSVGAGASKAKPALGPDGSAPSTVR